ncbi:tRNA 2-thiouridine(34) synthase MnmA [Candidatus Wolfebacteria bacterium CG18_big_fil_WC_8_21_14_2_50_39_7]|uniref:tRNA-specific 2-thiouridylase MnmA n=4 Tax=Candidatus Wolfeibacteriota TaxID=1752735 RepID=A0A2M7Q666_9BACT|nr:tRNA 2-thiouridine(34) synthase MnmA [Parcubacteria group bacterium]NCO89468.1 tRNA 2-thiouridine(34) synthase MnmA [Candidatus Wolfebacteria bacterium]PIP92099.1 MAG: tRNA 2-thiouridine(34) synthase MnmA [Candidatus Wolfebacteria bacterium CG18_big_fil_WC_8_21_14_2_50_39_7]PIU98970.1 MAG: tRNA 2-thiouridine(34) synthase MnmA [Candidatus Wolfebacteria bacterium CG03_land_8_20_14_0_80_39_317]PIY58931.1 MAG: tRNA 2-thiouridine(34) synthase MnmA [Candidatus Wolfebacteria bacterium CG_4_10_14_0_
MLKELKRDKKIFVAMSGGVDSSVAALLLKKQGYDVVGGFMKYWADFQSVSGHAENRCCSSEARRDAMKVCSKLNIPFLTWDFQKEFKKAVVNDFISGYKKGITPNPCVICNKEIKFGLFFEKALKMGADYVATGHYARLATGDKKQGTRKRKSLSHVSCRMSLFAAKDKNKDQSYFLWTLTQNQLKHCLFPIGDHLKSEVRQIAKKAGLPVALKRASQEVCFVYDADLTGFLKKWIKPKKGEIIELKTNKKIGEHNGIQFYTIGQRVPIGGTGPYYVFSKNLKKNQLIVIGKDDKNSLYNEIALKNVNWISGEPPKSAKILVRTRYRQPLVSAKIMLHASRFMLYFDQPVKFVAPGQSAVFYNKENELLGGGVII